MAATKGQIKERKNGDESDRNGNGSLTRKAYDRELARLHGELVKLQQWVVAKGLKVVIVFEGRDGAGKGGVIKAITERVRQAVAHQFPRRRLLRQSRGLRISRRRRDQIRHPVAWPTASWRSASATCSSGLSAARRLMSGAPTRTSPTKREAGRSPAA
jgi:hypothetical protein